MRTRILPSNEWWRIADSDLGRALPVLPPTTVIVCEDEQGAIVGHVGLVAMLHLEGVAITASGLARGRVWQHLATAAFAEARSRGERTLFPAAAPHDERMVALLSRMGAVEMRARWFALGVRES